MVKKLQPKLRFRGFTDAWEQRRFVECFDFLKTNTFPRDYLQLSGNGTVDIHYGDILINYNSCLSIANNALPCIKREDYLDCHNYSLLKDGDVVFADTAEDRTVGKCVELLKVGERRALAGLHTIAVRNRIECAVGYLGFYFNSPFYRKQLLPKMQGSKVVAISKDVLKQSFISVPSTKEQLLISKLLNKIDSLVDAEKRKLDLLKKKKTTLLLQVFDQKLRFKRYNTPWKQRHLGVLLEETNEVASDREILSVTVSNGIYPARDGAKDSNPGESIYKYKVVHINDIVYNSMRLWQGAIGISGYEGIVSPAYTVCHVREVVDARFCAYLLRSYPALREFYRYSQGNSKDTLILKYPEFSQIIVAIPPSFSEQEDIANTLDCLNQLIAAETRKIDMLRLKKKALLQQMFI